MLTLIILDSLLYEVIQLGVGIAVFSLGDDLDLLPRHRIKSDFRSDSVAGDRRWHIYTSLGKKGQAMRHNLKNARKQAGMTQQQVADKLGINPRYYKAMESGERIGSIKYWDALEDLLNVPQRALRENHPGTEDSR